MFDDRGHDPPVEQLLQKEEASDLRTQSRPANCELGQDEAAGASITVFELSTLS
jgi:hypothetical protein